MNRARCVTTTHTSTPAAAITVLIPACSPSNSQDQRRVSSGWASCTWLARATPARASPAYQAKNPRYIDTSAR
jgi:hypothetical protein